MQMAILNERLAEDMIPECPASPRCKSIQGAALFSVDVDDEIMPAISASAEFTVIDLGDGGISH
jgi:hypothetical protein